MAQRILEKLDKLQKFEKKIMRKYELSDNPEQEKVHFNPFVKSPLTCEFKLDYELSADARKRMSASPGLLEYGQSAFQCIESVCRPKSAVSLQLPRKKHSDEAAKRPFSAPASVKNKSGEQKVLRTAEERLTMRRQIFKKCSDAGSFLDKGNLQHLGDGFMILKLKAPHSTEGQKRPKGVPGNSVDMMQMLPDNQDTSTILDHIEVSCDDSPDAISDWHRESTVTVGKDDKLNLTTTYEKSSNQVAQDLEMDSTVRSFGHDHLFPDDPKLSLDSLLRIQLSNEIKRMTKKTACSSDSDRKEKKPFIPLCIEDELEKPNAKIIRTDDLGVKPSSSMKASESFPIYCNNEGYVQKYVLNRWLALYGDKAFYDTSKKNEVHVRLNPVLQNNLNESFGILRSRKHALANVSTKRKKKPIFSKKKMITSFQILSLERRPTLPSHPKERPSEQKSSDSFHFNRVDSIRRHSLVQRNISQTIPKCRKDVFMVYGINPITNTHHDASSTSLISKIKSQFPGCTEKPIVQCIKRSRLVHVDYIPISTPISVPTSEIELHGHNRSLSVQPVLVLSDSTDVISVERDKSKAQSHVPDKKCILGEGRLGGTEFLVSRYTTLGPEDGERPSGAMSALLPQSSPSESNDNPRPTKADQLTSIAEEEEAVLPHTTVISIPTAKDDASVPHRNPEKQETVGT